MNANKKISDRTIVLIFLSNKSEESNAANKPIADRTSDLHRSKRETWKAVRLPKAVRLRGRCVASSEERGQQRAGPVRREGHPTKRVHLLSFS
jgi:hypothetical protein